jgi:hypothetical protein
VLRRVVLWKSGYFLDIVLVSAAADGPIDLAWHHRGVLTEPASLQPADPAAYPLLQDVRRLPGPTWQAAWRVQGAGTRMWGRDPRGGQTFAATSPSNPPAERQATLLRRFRGRRACYAAVIEPVNGAGGTVRSVQWQRADLADGGRLEVVVRRASGEQDTWLVGAGPNAGLTVDPEQTTFRYALTNSDVDR